MNRSGLLWSPWLSLLAPSGSQFKILFLFVVTLLLSSCFQTEHVPEALLLRSHVQYQLDTGEGCYMRERVYLHVPKSIYVDSLRLCVQFDNTEHCEMFSSWAIGFHKDTLSVYFREDGRPKTLICTTYYNTSDVFSESLDLSHLDIPRYFPVPESLTIHIGDKKLHYVFSKSEMEYVSRDFQSSEIIFSSNSFVINMAGTGVDSIVIGGMITQTSFYAGIYTANYSSGDTIDLSFGERSIRTPKHQGFNVHFLGTSQKGHCGVIKQSGYPPLDTIMLPYSVSMIYIPAQPKKQPFICYMEDCRPL